jgi:drug/metabolite transporter (DMT)-like permease
LGFLRGRSPHTYVAITAGVIAVSFGSILIRMAMDDAPAMVIAAYRMGIAALVIVPTTTVVARDQLRLRKRDVLLCLVGAIFLALHFATWVTSLQHTSVASSVVLVTASPLMVAVASRLFLKESLERRVLAGIGLGLAGSMVIGIGDMLSGGSENLIGDVLAFLGAVSMTGYLLIGRKVRPRMPLMPYLAIVYAGCALLLLAGVGMMGSSLTGYTGETYLFLVLVALVPQVMGHSILNWSLARISATLVSVAVMAEPVIATILALALLNEVPPITSIIGGVVILTGIYLAMRRSSSCTERKSPSEGHLRSF